MISLQELAESHPERRGGGGRKSSKLITNVPPCERRWRAGEALVATNCMRHLHRRILTKVTLPTHHGCATAHGSPSVLAVLDAGASGLILC